MTVPRYRGPRNPIGGLAVSVKVGNDRYVAFDPDQTAGEYVYQMTLGCQYQVLAITGT